MDSQAEARYITRYLLGQWPEEQSVNQYTAALACHNFSFTEKENRIWQKCLQNRFLLGCIDGALALKNPQSGIRRKILLMQAILESAPAFAPYFLPQQRSGFYLFTLFFTGCRAVVKALLGYMLLWIW
jgi:hypothetical protein